MQLKELGVIIPSEPHTNIASAINAAQQAPGAAVWIPAWYTGGDAVPTTSGIPTFDMRAGGGISGASIFGPIVPQNLFTFRSTLTKIAAMQTAPPAQLRVLMWGDSVTGHHANAVVAGLRDSFGFAGVDISCQGTIPTGQNGSCVTFALSGGAFALDGGANPYDYTRSPNGALYVLPSAGGTATFGVGGGYQTANKLSIFYIAEPGAGTFQIQTNKNGAGWVTQSTVNASNATTIGAVASFTMPDTGPYQIQCVATSGTVRIFGPTFENNTINGVIIMVVARGGLQLNDATSTPTAVTAPWYAALNPDLITFEMKESSVYPDGSTYLTALNKFVSNWTAVNPLVDFLFIGSHPVNPVSGQDADQIAQNNTLRAVAQANNAFYWDGYYPNLNYATEKALGWITDGSNPHQTTLGQVAESNLLWQQLGFGSLLNGSTPRPIAAASSLLTKLRINNDITGLATDAGWIMNGGGFNFDLQLTPQRGLYFTDMAGNNYAILASTKTAFGQSANYLTPFQTTIFNNEVTKGPWIAASDANTVGIFQNPGSGALNNVTAKMVSGQRFKANQGILYSGADAAIVASAGWGNTAAVSAATGYDPAFSFTLTANGTGIAANPTITITFKDGTWTAAPQVLVLRNDLASPYGGPPHTISVTATTLTITFNGTPVSGSAYKFIVSALGN